MHTPNWEIINSTLKNKVALAREEATWAMLEMMSGNTPGETIKEFLVLMNEKSPTAGEIAGLVDAMLQNATKIDITNQAIDIVGTGGDQAGTINISTASALVVAAAGEGVIKHGNRAASSKTGSADVLEVMGLNLNLTTKEVADCFEENNITFCFAPIFHPAMRHVAPVRKELNVPTVFNILGPLANPAQPVAQATGVSSLKMAPLMAEVFAKRGTNALVMRGLDGLDEMSIAGDTQIWDTREGEVREELFKLSRLGIDSASIAELKGGEAAENAKKLKAALANKASEAVLNAIALNSAAAFVAKGEPDKELTGQLIQGFEKARDVLASGQVLELLEKWINWTKKIS